MLTTRPPDMTGSIRSAAIQAFYDHAADLVAETGNPDAHLIASPALNNALKLAALIDELNRGVTVRELGPAHDGALALVAEAQLRTGVGEDLPRRIGALLERASIYDIGVFPTVQRPPDHRRSRRAPTAA